jgi:hypothetical protein
MPFARRWEAAMARGVCLLTIGFLTAFCIMPVLFLAPAWGEEVLTNDTIIQMVRGGLPESVVVAKIRSTQTRFDLRAEALLALKKAGVPDKVMEAMVAPVAQTTSRPSIPPSSPPSSPAAPAQPAAPPSAQLPPGAVVVSPSVLGALQGRGTGDPSPVYHLVGQRQIELTPVGAEVQTNSNVFSGARKQELVLPGRTAGYRITERQPMFLSPSSPSDMPLVRLDPGSDDRNLKFGSFSNNPFVGTTSRQGVRATDRVDVEAERDASGFYRVRPRKPLEPGEYGFIRTFGMRGATSGSVYDFGVDK